MFRRKDRDRRTSLTSPSSALPPPPPPGPPSHSSRSASSSSYPDRDPSLRSATSPDPADSARSKRNSIFTWGSGNKAGGSSSPGADAGGRGSSGSPTTGGGLLGRTISRFSIAEEGPQHSAPPKGHLRRESSNLNPAAGGSSRVGEEYTTSFSSLPTAHSTSPSPHPPAPVPPQQTDPRALKALQHSFDLLTSVQPEKVYRTAPPTVKSLVATGVDGRHPKTGPPGTPGNDWKETWLELRGVVLHSWDMLEVAEHNARGEDKHPTRTNITDAYVELIHGLPATAHAPELGPHPWVFSVNSAGLNSTLFSCSTKEDMESWVTAIRLAGWENSRLEEVYTGHLIRSVFPPSHPSPVRISPSSPVLEGWFDVRTYGSKSWSHFWVVLSLTSPAQDAERRRASISAASAREAAAAAASSTKGKKRLSNMFGGGGKDREDKSSAGMTPYPPAPGEGSPTNNTFALGDTDGNLSNQPTVKAQFYLAPPGMPIPTTAATRRTSLSTSQSSSTIAPPATSDKPILTLTDLHQAYAVFPETAFAVETSGMFKLEGAMRGDVLGRAGQKRAEGWCLMIPVERRGEEWVSGGKHEMLRWLAAFHDAFGLYGRPRQYSWDVRDPRSLLFGHPGGPKEPELFIVGATPNPDEIVNSRPSFVRSRFRDLLCERLGMGVTVRSPTMRTVSGQSAGGARTSPVPQGVQGQAQGQRVLPASQNGRRESEKVASGEHSQRRASPSMDGGRPVAASQQRSTQGAAPVNENGGGGFQLPPLSFDEKSRSSSSSDGRSGSSQKPTPFNVDRTPVPAPRETFQSPAAVPSQTPTPPASTISAPKSPSPKTVRATLASAAQASNAASGAPQRAMSGQTSPGSEYAYMYTPSDAQTPASDYSQSSGPASAAISQAHTGPPSVDVQETVPEEPSWKEEESEEGFDGYVPAHLIETGLPVQKQQSTNVQPQPSQPEHPASTSSLSTHPSVRKKEMVSLGRRPSGARAAPPRRVASGSTASMPAFSDEEESHPNGARTPEQRSFGLPPQSSPEADTHAADALAALSFLENSASPPKKPLDTLPVPAPVQTAQSTGSGSGRLSIASSDERRRSLPKIDTFSDEPAQPPLDPQNQFPSSFGPGKAAAERRANLEAAERERQQALHRPGKASKPPAPRKPSRTGGWQSSDEDEDEEEEEDTEDEDEPEPKPSQPQPPAVRPLPKNPATMQQEQARSTSQHDLRAGEYPQNGTQSQPPSNYRGSDNGHRLPHSSSRSNMHAPQVIQPQPRPGGLGGGLQSRASIWNTHLEEPHGGLPDEDPNSKFVTIEPSATLTKAFNPNGLLTASLEDRNERSAKRQEEVARADGSSLVNVPPPPPPPQMGLLGAITGYEAQRSREGGVGAALTERDRERREADERARKADNLQRSQMEQMSQQGGYGYPYGQQQPQQGMMPGMMSPWGMPWGMQPQMSQYGGYGGQMDPQAQMIAQQAAQMAYQQAMMSYSQAGSQMGGSQMGSQMGSPMMGGAPSGYGSAAPMPYWGMGSPMGMGPPMSPFMPPQPSYPSSRAGSAGPGDNGTGARPGSAPSRGRSPGTQHPSRSPSNLDIRQQAQGPQASRSSTPRSQSKSNLNQ